MMISGMPNATLISKANLATVPIHTTALSFKNKEVKQIRSLSTTAFYLHIRIDLCPH